MFDQGVEVITGWAFGRAFQTVERATPAVKFGGQQPVQPSAVGLGQPGLDPGDQLRLARAGDVIGHRREGRVRGEFISTTNQFVDDRIDQVDALRHHESGFGRSPDGDTSAFIPIEGRDTKIAADCRLLPVPGGRTE